MRIAEAWHSLENEMTSVPECYGKLWETRDADVLTRLLWHEYDAVLAAINLRLPRDLQRIISPEDLIQDVFLTAFRSFDALAKCEYDAFRAWLFTIARARTIDAIRRQTAQKRDRRREIRSRKNGNEHQSLTNLFSEIAGMQNTPSCEVATGEAVSALKAAIDALPAEQQTAVQLRYLKSMDLDEVATRMTKTTDAIRNLLYRARKNIRLQMLRSSLWFDTN